MYGLLNGENNFDLGWHLNFEGQGQTLKTLKLNISKTVRNREEVSIKDFDVEHLKFEKHFEIEIVNTPIDIIHKFVWNMRFIAFNFPHALPLLTTINMNMWENYSSSVLTSSKFLDIRRSSVETNPCASVTTLISDDSRIANKFTNNNRLWMSPRGVPLKGFF